MNLPVSSFWSKPAGIDEYYQLKEMIKRPRNIILDFVESTGRKAEVLGYRLTSPVTPALPIVQSHYKKRVSTGTTRYSGSGSTGS